MSSAATVAARLDVHTFIKGHYASRKTADGQDVHVYAVTNKPVFADPGEDNHHHFDIELPLWGVTFILTGYIDHATHGVDANFFIKLAFLDPIRLGEFKGSLDDGVSVSFGVPNIIVGTATLYLKEDYLWLDLTATVLGVPRTISIQLIPWTWDTKAVARA